MQLFHFKNDSSKGLRMIPLDKHLIEPLIMQHKARQACAPNCNTLFFSKSFQPLEYEYFITLCGDALSIPSTKRVTAVTCRNMYETMYREFMHRLGFKLIQIAKDELDKSAAEGMLSSTAAVDNAYDNGDTDRGYCLTQPYWPMFKEFVQKDYEAKSSRDVWNFFEELPNIAGLKLNALG